MILDKDLKPGMLVVGMINGDTVVHHFKVLENGAMGPSLQVVDEKGEPDPGWVGTAIHTGSYLLHSIVGDKPVDPPPPAPVVVPPPAPVVEDPPPVHHAPVEDPPPAPAAPETPAMTSEQNPTPKVDGAA